MLSAESTTRHHAIPHWLAPATVLMLCVFLSVFLYSRYAPVFVSNDGAQYISTAKHLLRGAGFKTDLLYFDTHFLSGEIPAAQTIWPPGFPALIAATSLTTGLELHESAFLLGLLGLIGVGPIAYAIVRNAGGTRAAALLCACLCLAFAHAWIYPLVISTETLFVFFTLASLLFTGLHERDRPGSGQWALAGVMAASAFLIRYTGVFYVAAVGFWLLKEWFWGKRGIAWQHVAAFSLAPACVITGVFAWNYLMVGSLTSRSGRDPGFPLLDAMWEFRIPVSDILGYLREGMFSDSPAYVGLALMLLVGGFCAFRLRAYWPVVAGELRSRATVQIPLIYIGVTVAYMFYLTWGTSPGHVVPRYLATLFPFVLVVVLVLATKLPGKRSPLTASAAVLLVLLFVGGQANNATRLTELQQEGSKLALYLERPYSAQQTLRDHFLQVSSQGPIFTNEPQILGHYLDRPTVGATEAPFTTLRYDADRAKQIVDAYSVSVVVLFLDPPLAEPPQSDESADIYRDLAAGRLPDWLTREYADDYVRIYRPLP